jgi:hypothetical protein
MQVDVEAVDVVRPAAAVVGVPADEDPLTRPVPGDVVRTGGRIRADPLDVTGSVGGTAQSVATRAGKSGSGRFNLIVSLLPCETTRRTSRVYAASGDRTLGASVRSIALANPRASSRLPLLKRKPERSVNVYVRRSDDTRG